jgi:alpha-beta hydrolase superfamily lysophospholipase
MLKRRAAAVLLLTVLVLVIAGWITRPTPLQAPRTVLSSAPDPEGALQASEALSRRRYGITPGTEKRIRWFGEPGTRTSYVVVYLHGFSATRQEIAPVPERLAKTLGANLFETRLAGHGREREALVDVQAEAWLRDGEEALAIAAALGERIVLMGTSTGATLAVALAQHPQFGAVDSLLLLSPNFGPAAAGSDLATGPFGPQLVRLLAGEQRQWEAANAAQEKFWSTRYPNSAIIEMMRLVDLARELAADTRVPRAVLAYSAKDQVVSLPKLKAAFEALSAERKVVLVYDGDASGDPSSHILAGDVLAPDNTATLVRDLREAIVAP